MSYVASFARRCATGLVAAQMMFGAVSVSALAVAAPAHAAVMDYHGAWQGFSTTVDGQKVFGAITHMNNGGTAAFLALDGGLSLIMTKSDWHLKDGETVPIELTIDGTTYTATGIARGEHVIEMPRMKKEVLAMFVGGAQARLDVNGGDLVWTLDLHGFTASMADALKLVEV